MNKQFIFLGHTAKGNKVVTTWEGEFPVPNPNKHKGTKRDPIPYHLGGNLKSRLDILEEIYQNQLKKRKKSA